MKDEHRTSVRPRSRCCQFILHNSSFILLENVPRPGIEPGSPPSEGGVLVPLDHQGMYRQRKGRESNPHALAGPDLAGRRDTSSAHPSVVSDSELETPNSNLSQWSRGELNPRVRVCKTQPPPAGGPGSRQCRSDLGGSRTHSACRLRLSTGPVYQFQHEVSQLRTRESNPASRLMRPGRAPARPQCSAVVTVGFEPTLSTF
jgi:hypothetical protein